MNDVIESLKFSGFFLFCWLMWFFFIMAISSVVYGERNPPNEVETVATVAGGILGFGTALIGVYFF